jgi:hypothetical protein
VLLLRASIYPFLGLAALLLSACGTPRTIALAPATPTRGIVSNTSVAVVDKRPDDDRESSIGSLLITSNRYGIHTFGDDRFVPAPLNSLRERLQRATSTWSSQPQSITLIVDRLKTEKNMQAAMRNTAMNSTDLTEIGKVLGEAMLGKMREQNVDLRKPFVTCVIEASADIRWSDGHSEPRRVSVVKAQNYAEGTAQERQFEVVAATLSAALDAAVAALSK